MAIAVGASALVVNKNEDPEEAVKRETEEETGLRINRRFPIALDKLPSYVWRRTLGKRFGLVKL